MLLVKTFIKESTIPNAGMGCFAGQNISQGTKIWELNPLFDKIFTEANRLLMTDLEKQFLDIYAYKHNGLYFLCVDNARFFNHSSTPNTFDPNTEYATYAARDIAEGEEILSDYYTFGSTTEDFTFNRVI